MINVLSLGSHKANLLLFVEYISPGESRHATPTEKENRTNTRGEHSIILYTKINH